MRYIVVLSIAITMLFTGCKNEDEKLGEFAYFGGEIINPNKDFVTFYGPQMATEDTLHLDKNNRFVHKLENVEPGVYLFTHGGEYQMIVLEPEDSLMLRLNTMDFDESLVYSGKGSKKNNYYLQLFLTNENDNQKLIDHCKMEPEVFDSIMRVKRKEKHEELNEFLVKKPCSQFFESVAKARIDYNHYASKEIYPFGYFGYNKLVHVKDLPDNFYAYRKDIDYGDEKACDTYTYNRFLSWHFNNVALYDFYDDEKSHKEFNRYSREYNVAKVELIDSLVKKAYIKNNLLKYSVREFISKSEDYLLSEDLLNLFLEKSTNEDDKKDIKELAASRKRLKPGNIIPEVVLLDYKSNTVNLSELIEQPTVIYFWSSNYKYHYKNSHKRVKKLKEIFPEYKFIAVNVNDNNSAYFKDTLNKGQFPIANEYRFEIPENGKKTLAINSVDKVFVISKNKKIVHSNANLFDDKFTKKLAMAIK